MRPGAGSGARGPGHDGPPVVPRQVRRGRRGSRNPAPSRSRRARRSRSATRAGATTSRSATPTRASIGCPSGRPRPAPRAARARGRGRERPGATPTRQQRLGRPGSEADGIGHRDADDGRTRRPPPPPGPRRARRRAAVRRRPPGSNGATTRRARPSPSRSRRPPARTAGAPLDPPPTAHRGRAHVRRDPGGPLGPAHARPGAHHPRSSASRTSRGRTTARTRASIASDRSSAARCVGPPADPGVRRRRGTSPAARASRTPPPSGAHRSRQARRHGRRAAPGAPRRATSAPRPAARRGRRRTRPRPSRATARPPSGARRRRRAAPPRAIAVVVTRRCASGSQACESAPCCDTTTSGPKTAASVGTQRPDGCQPGGLAGVRLERHVDGRACRRAVAQLVEEPGPGEQVPPALVAATASGPPGRRGQRLDAVAVVDVEIDVQHAQPLGPGPDDGQRRVVVDAEAPRPGRAIAWWRPPPGWCACSVRREDRLHRGQRARRRRPPPPRACPRRPGCPPGRSPSHPCPSGLPRAGARRRRTRAGGAGAARRRAPAPAPGRGHGPRRAAAGRSPARTGGASADATGRSRRRATAGRRRAAGRRGAGRSPDDTRATDKPSTAIRDGLQRPRCYHRAHGHRRRPHHRPGDRAHLARTEDAAPARPGVRPGREGGTQGDRRRQGRQAPRPPTEAEETTPAASP